MKRGNILVILLITTVAILSLTAAGYLFIQNRQLQNQIVKPVNFPAPTPVSSPAPAIDPTANWKTYTNTKFGVSFRYPLEWNLKETSYSVGAEIEPDIRTVVGACPGYVLNINTRLDLYETQEAFLPVKAGVLDNQAVEIFETTNKFGCLTKRIYVNKFPKDGYKPKLIISVGGKKTRVILDQILSTFKFL